MGKAERAVTVKYQNQKGESRFTAGPGCKETQSYPLGLGAAVGRHYHAWRILKQFPPEINLSSGLPDELE
eukprot:9183553-Karenia_brevis.AAC.1